MTQPPLRIGILGLGSLGSVLAWHWRDQTLFALPRDQHSTANVRVQVQQQLWQQTLPCWQGEALDWLVICTKAAATLTALTPWRNHLTAVKNILLVQNGMGQQQQLTDWLQEQQLPCQLWAGMSTEGAYRADDRVVYAGQGDNLIGRWGTETPGSGQVVVTPPHTRIVNDIASQLRTKLAINAVINPLTAQLRCHNGELLQNPLYRQQLDALSMEIAGLYTCLGWPEAAGLVERVQQVAAATAANQSSTLQDVLHKRPTELPYICGYLLQIAAEKNYALPLTTALYQQLLEISA